MFESQSISNVSCESPPFARQALAQCLDAPALIRTMYQVPSDGLGRLSASIRSSIPS
jgi:hypothetical protein